MLFAHRPDLTDAAGLYRLPLGGEAPELGQSQTLTGFAPILAASYFPDGRRILVDNAQAIQLFDPQDSSLVWIRPDEYGRDPDVSPDGSTICFHRETDLDTFSYRQIMLMAPDGNNLRAITPVERSTYAQNGTFTPDGSKVLYRLTGDIQWTDFTTGEQHRFEMVGSDWRPAVSPSGEQIYFRRGGGRFPDEDSESRKTTAACCQSMDDIDYSGLS